MVRIFHQRIKCIGCNYCVEVASYRWAMDETDGKSILTDSRENKGMFVAVVGNDEYDANAEAAAVCPVNIIRIEKF
jgi:ferredoxin